MLAFAMVCLLILPIVVFRCELYTQSHALGSRESEVVATRAGVIWLRAGVVVALLCAISALSYEALVLKNTSLLALVAGIDGCLGLLLIVEVVWSLMEQNHNGKYAFDVLPFFSIVSACAPTVLGVVLVALASLGASLYSPMQSEGRRAAAAAVAVETAAGSSQDAVTDAAVAVQVAAGSSQDVVTNVCDASAVASASREPASVRAARNYAAARMCAIGFAVFCFVILPILVFAVELNHVCDDYCYHVLLVDMVLSTLVEEGVFAAIFLAFSAFSFRSLRCKDQNLLMLVVGFDGCCGLLLAVAAALSMLSESEASSTFGEHFPAFTTLATGSHVILAAWLVLLAVLGFRLATMQEQEKAEMHADPDSKAEAAVAAPAPALVPTAVSV